MPDPDASHYPLPSSSSSVAGTDSLTDSLTALSLSRPSSLYSNRKHSPPTLQRRTSMDNRSVTPSSLSPHSPRRPLSQHGPTTPTTLRHRSSMASLSPGSRNGSAAIHSAHGSPTSVDGRPGTAVSSAPEPQDLTAEVTVVLHDSSYKHRYSRANTSLADLATIVERPERIPAAVLGVSAAQIRAGRERFSIRKTERAGRLTDPEVMLVHAHTGVSKGKISWPEELVGMANGAAEKLGRGELEVPRGYHAGDLYLCGESLEDLEGCVGAVYDGVDLVFGEGDVRRGFVCIRPPGHHCAEKQPSGFCWLNNVHIAIAHAAKDHGLTHAVILDFDLHHGDGSQAIAWSLNELATSGSVSAKKTAGIAVPSIGYFSLHDINSYPCEYGDIEKIRNASVNLESHGQFIHNVHLKPYSTTDEFWQLYSERYSSILTKAREFLTAGRAGKQKKGRDFKAGVFVSAGFDASEHESPGMQRHKVHVPTGFFARFTADAVSLADDLADGRLLSVLEGGYSDRAITSGVLAHMCGLVCTPPERAVYIPPTLSTSRTTLQHLRAPLSWDPAWWDVDRLEELESYVHKMRHRKMTPEKPARMSSFMSATQASLARKESVKNPHAHRPSSSSGSAMPPVDPPKTWEQCAWELSRLFIPEYEEAKAIPAIPKAAKGARTKTERHSIATTEGSNRMTLRERKAKPEPPATAAAKDPARRRTVVPESRPVSRATSRAPSRAASVMSERAPSRAASVMSEVRAPRSTTTAATAPAAARNVGARPNMPPPAAPARGTAAVSAAASARAPAPRPAPSRVPTKAAAQKPASGNLPSSPTTTTKNTSASPPPLPSATNGMDELTQGLQRVKLTYKNAHRDAEAESELKLHQHSTPTSVSTASNSFSTSSSDAGDYNTEGDSIARSSDGEHEREHHHHHHEHHPEHEHADTASELAKLEHESAVLEEKLRRARMVAKSASSSPTKKRDSLEARRPVTSDSRLGKAGAGIAQLLGQVDGEARPARDAAGSAMEGVGAGDHTFRHGAEIRFGDPFPRQS